ncbi:hypothetical protein V6Z12_D10G211400 [Gossypium hirsutum]
MRDFNEILSNEEKQGSRLREGRMMFGFHEVLEASGLIDMRFKGRWHTWERGNFASNNICERLERGMATENWYDVFPNYTVNHLNNFILDHCPLLLNTIDNMHSGNRSSRVYDFKFEQAWLLHQDFDEIVSNFLLASSYLMVPDRLAHMGLGLKSWAMK